MRRSTKRGERAAAPGSADPVATPSSPGSTKRPKRAAKPASARAPKTIAKAPAATPTAASSRWTDSAAKAAAPKVATPDPPGPEKPAVAAPPRAAPRRKVPAAGYAVPSTRAAEPPASAGAELISTTIQAAAELAQIGLTVGRQTLQSMLDRLPKP